MILDAESPLDIEYYVRLEPARVLFLVCILLRLDVPTVHPSNSNINLKLRSAWVIRKARTCGVWYALFLKCSCSNAHST